MSDWRVRIDRDFRRMAKRSGLSRAETRVLLRRVAAGGLRVERMVTAADLLRRLADLQKRYGGHGPGTNGEHD